VKESQEHPTPTLPFACGEREGEGCCNIAAALPQAEVQAFADANHYVLEDRHEVLVPMIRRFLDAHRL
jgi:hypothetical protein